MILRYGKGRCITLVDFMNISWQYKINLRKGVGVAILQSLGCLHKNSDEALKGFDVIVHKNHEGVSIDDNVIGDMVETTKLRDNLMILFCSDNGYIRCKCHGETFGELKKRVCKDNIGARAMYSRDDYIITTIYKLLLQSNHVKICSNDMYRDSFIYQYMPSFSIWVMVQGAVYKY